MTRVSDVQIGITFRAVRRRLGLRQADVARRARSHRRYLADRAGTDRIDRSDAGEAGRRGLGDPARCRRFVARAAARARPQCPACVAGRCRPRAVRGCDGLGDRLGGLVLDLRGARRHRHRRLARGFSNAVDRRAQDGAGRSSGIHRHDGSSATVGGRIVADRGWRPRACATWVILADTRTNRRHVAQHARLLRGAFPANGHAMRRLLGHPDGPSPRCRSCHIRGIRPLAGMLGRRGASGDPGRRCRSRLHLPIPSPREILARNREGMGSLPRLAVVDWRFGRNGGGRRSEVHATARIRDR